MRNTLGKQIKIVEVDSYDKCFGCYASLYTCRAVLRALVGTVLGLAGVGAESLGASSLEVEGRLSSPSTWARTLAVRLAGGPLPRLFSRKRIDKELQNWRSVAPLNRLERFFELGFPMASFFKLLFWIV